MKRNGLLKKIAAILTATATAIPSLASAQPQNQQAETQQIVNPSRIEKKEGLALNMFKISSLALADWYITLTLHESSHAIAAQMMGAEGVNLYLFPHNHAGDFYFGRCSWNADFSPGERIFVSAAGFSSTRMLAELADGALNKELVPPYLERAIAIFYLMGRADLPRYLLSSSYNQYARREQSSGDDVYNIVSSISSDRVEQNWIYAGLIAFEVLDLYLDREEIRNNVLRALGREVQAKKHKKFGLDLEINPVYIGLQLTYSSN